MAKFCTKCGKELKEGQKCDCSKKEAVKTTTASSNGGVFSDFGEILKGSFAKPVTTIKEFSTESNFILALILLGVCAVVSGIFVYVLCDTLMSAVASLLGTVGGVASLLGGSSTASLGALGAANMLSVSFGDVFFTIFIYVAIYLVVLAAMLLLMTKVVFKEDTNFKQILTVVGLSSIFTTCTFIVSCIALKINFTLGLFIFVFGLVFGVVNLTAGSIEALKVKKDKMVYSLFASLSVAIFVLVYVLPKIFS